MSSDSLNKAYNQTFPRVTNTTDIHLREDKETGNTRAVVKIPKGRKGIDGERKGSAMHESVKSAIAHAFLDAMDE